MYKRQPPACALAFAALLQYQPHSYHTALTILRAFAKRNEFNNLLAAAPGELRRSSATGKSLSYETREDACSSPVCLKHAKAIAEMGRRAWVGETAGTSGGSSAPVEVAADASTTMVAVAMKGEPGFTPAGGREGDQGAPPVVASGVAFDPPLSEDRYQLAQETSAAESVAMAVSYTHLTLPTNREV